MTDSPKWTRSRARRAERRAADPAVQQRRIAHQNREAQQQRDTARRADRAAAADTALASHLDGAA